MGPKAALCLEITAELDANAIVSVMGRGSSLHNAVGAHSRSQRDAVNENAVDRFDRVLGSGRGSGREDIPVVAEILIPYVGALINDDHGQHSGVFDAAEGLQSLNDDAILSLAADDWGACEEADLVAYHCESIFPDVKAVLDFVHSFASTDSHAPGFSCQMDALKAREWVRIQRPHLLARIDSAG